MTVEHSQRIERERERVAEMVKEINTVIERLQQILTETITNMDRTGTKRERERERERETKIEMNKERPGVSPGLMVMA